MAFDASRKALVAVDLGAQSCRVSLLRWNGDNPEVEVVHRFPNAPIESADGLRWDLDAIVEGVFAGLRLCGQRATEGIASVAVDGWAVDYVRVDENNTPVAPPFCYRDARTEKAEIEVHALIDPARLYSLTGIQILRINTIYQLYADKSACSDSRPRWMNLPEYITYRLCGKRISEYTNSTHTGLVQLGTQTWCEEIFRDLGLAMESAPEIVPSGTKLGPITGVWAELPSFRETRIIAAACHDTAAAIAAIPATGDDWAFISSGTWSLVGTVLEAPCVNEESRSTNFTNLGSVGGKICFLKNVNGMWLLQQCMEEWEKLGISYSHEEIVSRCAALPAPAAFINVDHPQLMLPGNMLQKINQQLREGGEPGFAGGAKEVFSVANLIFHSMAARYATALSAVGTITGKKLKRLFIVGGGSRNHLLNALTAKQTGLEVLVGSTESTTIGNFAIQMAANESGRESSGGVRAESVARWAQRFADIALFSERETPEPGSFIHRL